MWTANFIQKLLLTLLDKGILAIVVAFVGFKISRSLEDYKAHQQKVAALERDKANLTNEMEKLKRTREIDFKEKQLSQFYWPVYIRLMKDTAVWRTVAHLTSKQISVPPNVGKIIETTELLKNHEEIVSIMQSNIHLAGADEEFLKLVAGYARHVAVYKALRVDSSTANLNPIDVNEPMPAKLIPGIKERIERLQREYDVLVRPSASAGSHSLVITKPKG